MVPETIAGKIVGGVCSLSGGMLFYMLIVVVVAIQSFKYSITYLQLHFLSYSIQFNCISACDRFACARYCV